MCLDTLLCDLADLLQASSTKAVLSFMAIADVDVPQITFSSRSLSFQYLYHPLLKMPPKAETLTIRNTGRSSINAVINAPMPFSVSPTTVHLEPNESVYADVTMNHAYRKDLVSHKPRWVFAQGEYRLPTLPLKPPRNLSNSAGRSWK